MVTYALLSLEWATFITEDYNITSGLTREIHRPSAFILCPCSNCVSKACIYIVYIVQVHVYLVMDDQCWLCFGKTTPTNVTYNTVNMESGMNMEAIGLLTKSAIYILSPPHRQIMDHETYRTGLFTLLAT